MKQLVVLLVLLAGACTEETRFGKCVGLNDYLNKRLDPKIEYRLSAYNLTIGFVTMPLIYPPIKVILDEAACPSARSAP
jgi:hypothetical protein